MSQLGTAHHVRLKINISCNQIIKHTRQQMLLRCILYIHYLRLMMESQKILLSSIMVLTMISVYICMYTHNIQQVIHTAVQIQTVLYRYTYTDISFLIRMEKSTIDT